ncbi:MAG: 50S ribosomal protein L4 [Candidatus Omnitrophica bacterium]|jgi:large subunit ribosomal protein L4|nr:50S ribosomal protein L4 [Candidatus Omnitrophota bacterium]
MTNKKVQKIINTVPVFDVKGKKEGMIDLDSSLFTGSFSLSILAQASKMYSANKRVGLASTKVRSEVSGGGKKPWKQKGTGRARSGSSRSPLWRGGGVVFGPHPHSFKQTITKRMKRTALLHSLNAKIKDGEFVVIEDLLVNDSKTKSFTKIFDKIKFEGSTLVAVDQKNENLNLSSRNIKNVTVVLSTDLNAFDILKHKNFLVTKKGLDLLSKRLKG